MKTLLTLFSQERSELQKEVDKATSLEQVVKLVQDRIDGLEKAYTGGLSVAQVRLASFLLDTLRQSISTITAATKTKISDLEHQQIAEKATRFPNSLILKLLQALVSVGIFSSLFSLTQDALGAWMDILLMSLLVGLEVLQVKDKRENRLESPQPVEVPQIDLRVDSQVLLDNLTDALNTVDLAVTSAEAAKKPLDSSEIEQLPELLSFLQRLMGALALEKPQMTLELTRLLPQVLIEQGIHSQIYQPDDELSNRAYFDFEPSIDRYAKEYVTIAPALLKGDRLLRRGRVIEPAYSGAMD